MAASFVAASFDCSRITPSPRSERRRLIVELGLARSRRRGRGRGIENRSERYFVMRYEAIICHNYSGSVTARIAVNLHETDNILRGDNSAPQPPIEAQTINLSWRAPTWNSTLDRANERHEGDSPPPIRRPIKTRPKNNFIQLYAPCRFPAFALGAITPSTTRARSYAYYLDGNCENKYLVRR